MFVKPADRVNEEGRPILTRDPDLGDFLPAEGRNVPETTYWHRRVRDGDVVVADADVQLEGQRNPRR
jgi:hypothetical protein